ncbi:hypothetical protein NL676_033685 [Syzygium grande]|nr:hypothetical protein NL676_033685 [Syzygium grande]
MSTSNVDRHGVSASNLALVATWGGSKPKAISVEQHTEDRGLCDAVVASPAQTRSQSRNEEEDDDDVRALDSVHTETRSSSLRKRKKKPYSGSSMTETGCRHACCNDCAATYVTSQLRNNMKRIGCPVSGCGGILEPAYWSSILPHEVFDRWGNALCEAMILEAERFYCPFTDCSALLIDEGGAVVAPASFSQKRKCKKDPRSGSLVTETDQPSNSKPDPSFICEICIEPRTNSDLFRMNACSHAYCNDCVTQYVTSKLGDNMTRIGCPVSGCGGVLEPEYCRSILPLEVFDRWGNALCEALILEGERFYCPFRDCSALLIHDGGTVVRENRSVRIAGDYSVRSVECRGMRG